MSNARSVCTALVLNTFQPEKEAQLCGLQLVAYSSRSLEVVLVHDISRQGPCQQANGQLAIMHSECEHVFSMG